MARLTYWLFPGLSATWHGTPLPSDHDPNWPWPSATWRGTPHGCHLNPVGSGLSARWRGTPAL